MIRLTKDKRLFVCGHRCHHAVAGVVVGVVGMVSRHTMLGLGVAVILIVHDWADRREWIPDLLQRYAGDFT